MPLAVLLVASTGCGGGSAADAVRDSARDYYRALAQGDSAAVCKLSTARSRRSLAAAARLQRLAAGAAPQTAARATCIDVRLPAMRPVTIVGVRTHGDRARVRIKGSRPSAGGPFRRQGDEWRSDRTFPSGNPFPRVPASCVQSWNDPGNATMRAQELPRAVQLPAAGLLDKQGPGGCRLRVRGAHSDATFAITSTTSWTETSTLQPAGTGIRFNVRVFKDGLLQPLTEVAAGASAPQAPPATPPPAPPPAAPAPAPTPGPWQECGRILSPLDRRPLRVEARTFDCRAGRRVAVRFLRDGSLPYGWQPTDCAASRPACERGGWAFRVVK
jgi:hypothetical protein